MRNKEEGERGLSFFSPCLSLREDAASHRRIGLSSPKWKNGRLCRGQCARVLCVRMSFVHFFCMQNDCSPKFRILHHLFLGEPNLASSAVAGGALPHRPCLSSLEVARRVEDRVLALRKRGEFGLDKSLVV